MLKDYLFSTLFPSMWYQNGIFGGKEKELSTLINSTVARKWELSFQRILVIDLDEQNCPDSNQLFFH